MIKPLATAIVLSGLILTGCSSFKPQEKAGFVKQTQPLQKYIRFIEKHKAIINELNKNSKIFDHTKNYASYPPSYVSVYIQATLLALFYDFQYDITKYNEESRQVKNLNKPLIEYTNHMIKAFKIYNDCMNQKKSFNGSKKVQYFTSKQTAQINIEFKKAKESIILWQKLLTQDCAADMDSIDFSSTIPKS